MHLKQVNKFHKMVWFNKYKRDNYWWFLFLESSMIRSDDTYAKDRIRSARLKLNGINPAVITAYV